MTETHDAAFAGKIAIVTGGGTGLGRVVTRGLVARGARAVVVASRDPAHHAEVVAEGNGRIESLVLDVREPDRIREAFDAIAAKHGGIDVLINNAAGNFIVPSLRLKPKAWRAVIDIALSGTFFCSQAAGRVMAESGRGGSIVNIGATYAWTGMPGVVHSAAAKAGVLAITRTLAVEWAPHAIRVNCVAPGPFDSHGAEKNLWPTPAARAAIERTIPTGRFASVDEVAAAVLWLASPAAPSVTGDCLVIDGGQSLGRSMFDVIPS